MARRRNKAEERKFAQTRVACLLDQAALRPDFSRRYVVLARRVAQKQQLRLTRHQRSLICRKCSHFMPGNSRTRLRNGWVVRTCLKCQHIRRIPLEH